MTANLPDASSSSSSSGPPSVSSSHVSSNKLNWMKRFLVPSKKLPNSSSGRRFGFSQNDSDDLQVFNPDDNNDDDDHYQLKKKYHHVIESVNFGDRNFASQWMQDSFEEVAVSHPIVDKLIGLVVSKQTQAMVRAIIKTANSFGQGFRVTGIQLLKAALLIQHFYDGLPRCMNSEPIVEEEEWILRGCHYFKFALVAYGWRGLVYLGVYGQTVRGVRDRRSNRLAILRYLKIDPQDLLGYEYALRKGASFQPSYYVALDRSRKAIVLSIRGTWSLYDAITDLVCEYKPWKGGLVHSGMLASAQWFYTHIIPQIFRYIHHYKKQLERFIITGHSLGGGTASVLTMMVADHVEELKQLSSPGFELHCYNYAPAAVCSVDLCERYSAFISSFVCKDDIVARLSYGTAMKLKELVLDMITAYETLGGFRALYIPGRIFHIDQDQEEKKYLVHETTHEISNEMKLTKTCIEDHMITTYQNAFEALKDQLLCK
ncbi:Alpha/Beta hydrolase protein [Pilaira anomala]|nr:Alpha/Beta hydrolase protein [Pilaira anomala]